MNLKTSYFAYIISDVQQTSVYQQMLNFTFFYEHFKNFLSFLGLKLETQS